MWNKKVRLYRPGRENTDDLTLAPVIENSTLKQSSFASDLTAAQNHLAPELPNLQLDFFF